jgi:hypothetical protein
MKNRLKILQELVTFSQPLELIAKELSQFDWDYDGKPYIIKPIHIVNVLNRFLFGDLTAKELEDWANLIECREDLEYHKSNYEQLDKIISELANPEIDGELTIAKCQKMFLVFSLPRARLHHYTQQIGLALEWALRAQSPVS